MSASNALGKLAPAKPRNWLNLFSNVTERHLLNGRLVHPNGDPCRNQKVKVYMKGWIFNRPLADLKTYKHGNFQLEYKWHRPLLRMNHNLVFKIFEETLPKRPGVDVLLPERVLCSINVTKPAKQLELDVGAVVADFFEYQEDFPTLKQPKNFLHAPEEGSLYYFIDFIQAAFKSKIIEAIIRLWKGLFTTEKVQKLYGSIDPNLKVTPETTIDMLLNGIYPWHFQKGSKEDEMILDIKWDNYVLKAAPDLPNALLKLHRDKATGKLSIKEVQIQYRNEDPLVCEPGQPDFTRALYLFNSVALVRGEVVTHLGMGHLWSGQAAMAAYRNLRDNPLTKLLFGHLYGVHRIDHIGATAIFGKDGVLAITGLAFESISQSLKDVLGGMCYTSFKPRKPLNEDHRFAKAEHLYWNIISESVDKFFEENRKGIIDNWSEIHGMSKNLVENSPPYKPWDNVQDRNTWIDTNEIDDSSIPHAEVNGEVRSIRPITISEDAPEAGDIDRLKQFCRHAIFMSTFWHWAVHNSQGKWVTNLKAASMAPRNRAKEEYGGTTPADADRQLSVAHTLMKFDGDNLIDNPHENIYPYFIDMLRSHIKDFYDLGYDIKELPYGTII